METRELVNLFAVAQALDAIQLAHFMAVILPHNASDREHLLELARALIAQLRNSTRFAKVFPRIFTYPTAQDLLDQLDRPTLSGRALQQLFIDAMFEMVWSAMGDERCSLKEIRERMITLAAELLVKKYKSMTIRARKEWRFEERAAWVRQELAKHNPHYAELCTDSVLHRQVIRIVTAVLKEDGVWMRARRRRAPKTPVKSDASEE